MSAPVWHDYRPDAGKPKTAPTAVQPIVYFPPDPTYLPPRVSDPVPAPTPSPTPSPAPGWLSWVTTILGLVLPFILANWKVIFGVAAIVPLYLTAYGPSIEADSSSVFSYVFPNKFVRAGRSFRTDLGESAQVGGFAYEAVIRAGGKKVDAETALEDQFDAAHKAAFAKTYTPMFNAIVPSGQQPTTPEKQKQLADAWHDFSVGAGRKTIFEMLFGWL